MGNPFAVIQRIQEAENNVRDFIQNGPDDGIGGYVRNQYRDRCDQFANVPEWAKRLASTSAGTFDRICKPYWDDNGNDGPVAEPPFTGGQCECELYQIDFEVEGTSDQFGNPFSRDGTFKARGPIGSPFLTDDNSRFRVSARSNRAGIAAPNPSCGDPQDISVDAWGFPSADAELTTFTVTSLASEPGDCGDPEPELKPGPNPPTDPGPTPGPEPTDDPRGRPFPIIPIPPFEDPVFGPQTFDDDDDEPTDTPGNPSGGDGLPGNPDAVGDEAGSTAGGDDGGDFDFGPPPEGRIWVGALLQATVDLRLGNIPGTGPNNTVYPATIGNAHLIYEGARDISIPLRSRQGVLTRPVTALVVIGCFIQAQPGVTLTVRGISAIICPENPCGEEEDG